MKIGAKKGNRFKHTSKQLVEEAGMAEGTRLGEMNEHLNVLEERMQQLTSECNEKIEEKTQQISEDCSKRIGALTHQLDEMQMDGQHKFEAL